MARPNKGRTLEVESILAARIRRERVERDLTYEALSKQMEAVGCAIQPSAIQKIEKSGRRIVVDEALAFSLVFDIPIAELITPASVQQELQMKRDLLEGPNKRFAMTRAQGEYGALVERAAAYLIVHGLDHPLWVAFEDVAAENLRVNGDRDSLTWAFRQDVVAFHEQLQREAAGDG